MKFGPRRLIPRLELIDSEALFVDSMPPKLTIPTPSAKQIERLRLKALEWKRKQAKVRKKVEKEARPKKKARATKRVGPEPFDTGVQDGPLEPISERLVELSPSSSQQPLKAPASEEVPFEGDKLGPYDCSITITIPSGVTSEEGVRQITNGIRALV